MRAREIAGRPLAGGALARRSSRSVFGPSGDDRPDMLTDADTILLPVLPDCPAPAPPGSGTHGPGTRGPGTGQRLTRVSRLLLLAILCLQAILSLRLHNTAFEDEALYLYSGHMELEHLLHGAALQGDYATFFSGSPVLYPVLAAVFNGLGGLAAARLLSLAEMLAATVLLYSLTRRLLGERAAVSAALLFSVTESAVFLGNFATYDATCVLLLAGATWLVVRTASHRWPLFLLAAPVAALAVAVKYAGLMFVPTIAVLLALAAWPARGWRALPRAAAFGAAVGGLLYAALHLAGPAYLAALQSTTTNRAQGTTPVTTLLRESLAWGGLLFALALLGSIAYAWRPRTGPDERPAPPGGRLRRAALGALLTGTALLAPAYQAHLHTDISFQKHIGFGLFFAAPMAGVGLARLLGDHFRRPQLTIGVWSLALIVGLIQTSHLYQEWPASGAFVRAFSAYLHPGGRYLVEVPEVPIYYLMGRPDAQPRQFTSTFYISYTTRQRQTLAGPAGFAAAVRGGYFDVIAYSGDVTPAADQALVRALSASQRYRLASIVPTRDVFGAGYYYIWVKRAGPHPAPGRTPARAAVSH